MTQSADGLDIVIPVRRTPRTTVVGVAALAPLAYEFVRLAVVLALVGPGIPVAQAGSFLGILVLSTFLGLLVRVPVVLFAMVGLHLLFGATTVRVQRSKVSVYRGVRGLRAYFSGTDPRTGLTTVQSTQDERGRWVVRIDPGPSAPARSTRPLLFGGGDLDRGQADGLARAIGSFLGTSDGSGVTAAEPGSSAHG